MKLFCRRVLPGRKLGARSQGRLQGGGHGAGTNTRFVVTTRTDAPKDLYDFYVKRGESENWIKDFKLHIKADRLSCSRFVANQFRLLLHAAPTG